MTCQPFSAAPRSIKMALLLRRSRMMPQPATRSKPARLRDLALRLMGGCLFDIASWSASPSIAAVPISPEIDVTCHKANMRLGVHVGFSRRDGFESRCIMAEVSAIPILY